MEKDFFCKSIKIDEEIRANGGENFPPIKLFGYIFQPVAAYIMECTLLWKKKLRAWESKEGGIPIRVEFICYKG